jgi:hypothetical protein
MPAQYTEPSRIVTRRKPDKRRSNEPPVRLELRVDPAWLARVQQQADRHGLSVSAYLREAGTIRLERDEASDPDLQDDVQ